MTQYFLSVHHTVGDAVPSEDEIQRMYASVDAFNRKLQETGAWVYADGLTDVGEAKVVDASAGARVGHRRAVQRGSRVARRLLGRRGRRPRRRAVAGPGGLGGLRRPVEVRALQAE